ncbi:putative IgGFc-binding protein [Apostichopus japonicus]|uniref:Putative IgGFc-binding protein n=1 Tax=Stichopus japonicus TaxID=307972 RepID=A0A2G8K8X9_STIJA|nr:putative IgGFc-binding protein [Apostichopus japonicus]
MKPTLLAPGNNRQPSWSKPMPMLSFTVFISDLSISPRTVSPLYPRDLSDRVLRRFLQSFAVLESVTSWGTTYALAPFRGRETAGYIIRVISAYRNTRVRLSNSKTPRVLQNGRFFELSITHRGILEITSNNPILVLQYQKGNDVNDLENGDPSMVIVPSNEQSRRGDIIFPVYEIESAHVTVRLVNGDPRSLLLNGQNVEWEVLDTDYAGAKLLQRDVPSGYHVISHLFPKAEMSVLVYGNEHQKSWAHPGVYRFEKRPPGQLTVANPILMTEFGLAIRIDNKYNAEIGLPQVTKVQSVVSVGPTTVILQTTLSHPGRSVDNFATSWVVNVRETCEAYRPVEPCDDGGGSPNLPRARRLCAILRQPRGPFADCLDVVDSDPYYETCIYDLCAMLPDDSMLCNHFEQYAQACRNSGERPGDWRATRNQCAIDCPEGLVYNPCGTGCPATCVDENPLDDCPMSCLETCECPPGTVLDGTRCVNQSMCGCPLPDGGYASDGEEVMFEDCTLTCFCQNGTLECTEIFCDENAECDIRGGVRNCFCNDGFVGNGTFCEPAPKYCQIFGDPHYNTYDNVMYRFAGECSYKLTETCGRIRGVPTFRVVGTNEKTLDGYESTNLKSIQLSVKGKTYVLDSSGQATVQGSYVDSYPYVDEDSGIVITLSYPSLMIMTDFGVNIKYNILGNGSASIEVPPWYFGKLCGLCGNADGEQSNEYKLPNGNIVTSPVAFANEWNVGFCPTEAPINPEPCQDYPEAFAAAKDNCYFLIADNGPLSQCHDFVDPSPYYEACLFDLCSIYPYREFMCDSAMHYVEACQHAGGRPRNWRNMVPDCDMRCPINSTYGDCNTGCPKTCSSPEGLRHCPMDCLETCECPPGYVLDNDRCVRLSQCRCPDPDGGMVQPGTVHVNSDCTFRCKCIDGVYTCFNITCSENAVCELQGSFQDCYCNEGYRGDGLECYAESSHEGRCDPSWYTPRDGSCYGYYAQPKSFEDAAALCERNYGYLVAISDVTENAFVTRLSHGERAWIGGLRNTSLDSAWQRTDATYSFRYIRKQMPEGIHRMEFSVRARKNAHIALSPYDSDNPDMYEIVIGGWSNTKSAIRRCKGCDSEVEVDTPDILNPRLDVRFYITFLAGTIEVGLLGEDPFMSWTDPDPIECNYIGYTTALNGDAGSSTADEFVWLSREPWIFENWRRGEPSNHQGNEGCIETNFVTEGLWNDHQCSARKPFVCEIPQDPDYLDQDLLP